MLLPGVRFETFTEVFQQVLQGPGTERLLIFGTAQDGPLNVPVPVRDPADITSIFGPATYANGYLDPNTSNESGLDAGASLPAAVSQAIKAGCRDIWVCRATGTYAQSPSAIAGKLSLIAKNPGRIYNRVTFTTTTTGGVFGVYITQPPVKGRTIVNFSFPSTATVATVIDTVNRSRDNTTVTILRDAFSATLNSVAYTTISSGTTTLGGGTGGVLGTNGCRAVGEDYGPDVATGVNGFATMLTTTDTGTFDMIENLPFPFDLAVLTGIYIDDQVVNGGGAYSTTIATDFIRFLNRVSNKVNPCAGVMAVRPTFYQTDASYISYLNNSLLEKTYGAWDSSQRWNKAGPFLYAGWQSQDPQSGMVFDDGSRLMVIAGPPVTLAHPELGNYTDMWHVNYAAWLTTIPPERSPRFQAVPGVIAYNRTIPKKYADLLGSGVGFDSTNEVSGKGAYTVLVRDPQYFGGPLVLFDDPTAGARNNFFYTYQVLHLTNRIESDLANALRPFIGRETSVATIAAMKTRAKNLLDGYALAGAFRGFEGQGYRFDISVSGLGAALGEAVVMLDFFPANSLRSIKMTVNVRSVG